MPPAGGRFGPQALGGPFSHFQQPHLQHHSNQHQQPVSAGLPPPSFNSHNSLAHHNPNTNLSPFAQTNGISGMNGLAAGFSGVSGINGGGTGLASHAAVMGFAHGAAMQQQQQARDALRRTSGTSKAQNRSRIREVWQSNLVQEIQNLRELVEKYPYISMDTEFPGVVARPMGKFTSSADYHYQTMRCNVDLLQVIQLGITLFSENGEMPPSHGNNMTGGSPYQNSLVPCPCTWQFNFRFSVEEDMHNAESIEFLTGYGMNMEMHEHNGIDPREFGALLITSGLVLLDDVRWISFHSGYDFGYLVKIMLCKPLPDEESEYRKLLQIFFPSIYDIKFMIKNAQRTQMVNDEPLNPVATNILTSLGVKSGLQDLADELGIKRVGPAHQAGSDSLITGKVFWEVKKTIFNGRIDDAKYIGQIWGFHNKAEHGVGGQQTGAAQFDGLSTPNLNGATIYSSNGTPSTPSATAAGPVQTPNQQSHVEVGSMGALTPGGGGGVFGRFGFGKG